MEALCVCFEVRGKGAAGNSMLAFKASGTREGRQMNGVRVRSQALSWHKGVVVPMENWQGKEMPGQAEGFA